MTYTFFLRGFAPLTRECGLSIGKAFDRVVEASGYHHAFEDEDGRVVLILTTRQDDGSPPIILKATAPIEGDGEDEVMEQAMDGRLGGFMAVQEAEYASYLHEPPAAMNDAAIRFLILTALKAHIHVIPKVRDMQTGHAKRMLDAGVESLAQAVASTVLSNSAAWLKSRQAGAG